jgi:hypothetical protein
MASTYTPLGVELQATGENAGTWGTKTNTNLQLVEQISGGYIAKVLQVVHKQQLYQFLMAQQVQNLHIE